MKAAAILFAVSALLWGCSKEHLPLWSADLRTNGGDRTSASDEAIDEDQSDPQVYEDTDMVRKL